MKGREEWKMWKNNKIQGAKKNNLNNSIFLLPKWYNTQEERTE